MRTLTTLFILVFAIQNAFTQFYLTAGVSKSKEGGDYYSPKIYEDLFSSAINDRYRYVFYELGALFKNEGIVYEANLSLTYKNLHLSGREGCTSYSEHGQFSDALYHYKNFDVKYAYLGPRLTISKAFFHKKKFNLLFGGFLSIEIKLGEKERNHYDSIVQSYTGIYYNQLTMQEEHTSSETYEISRAEYDGFQTVGGLVSVGLTLSPSYTIDRFRISTSISMGLNFYPRTRFNVYSCWNVPDKQKLFYPKFEMSVGYQLERKK